MVAQEAFDVRGSTINKTEGSLGSRAGNYHPVLIDAIRAADNGRNVARHCFDVVTVSTNPWRGLRGIAIGSNKGKRERAAKVVLAVAATRGSLPPGAQRPRTGGIRTQSKTQKFDSEIQYSIYNLTLQPPWKRDFQYMRTLIYERTHK